MRKFYKITDDENGNVILTPAEAGWVDGYSVGDTLLEDVKFKITVNPDNTLNAEVHPYSVKYFSRLNTKMWIQEILDFAEDRDIFDSDPDSEDEYELILYDHNKPFDRQAAYFDCEPTFKE